MGLVMQVLDSSLHATSLCHCVITIWSIDAVPTDFSDLFAVVAKWLDAQQYRACIT